LEDEEFFYVVMDHLEDLPDVDRMLSYVALAPRGMRGNSGALFGNVERQSVTARMASKGISALVCIKSTLSVIPSFAHVLEVQLRELDGRETAAAPSSFTAPRRNQDVENGKRSVESDRREDDESTTIVESETSRNEDDSNAADDSDPGDADNATTARESGLRTGLGRNDAAHAPTNTQSRHQLLRAILIAMKQPALSRVLSAVTDIFTESTAYSKNGHAMRHQECFALKPNTDGMMDVLRKAFLANVDDIYRLADEYAETYDITVQVRETISRGYYLSVSADLGLDLPQIFIQPVKNGRFIHCTTEEVSDWTFEFVV
jgi:DNA mismatch repair protein MSH4